MGFLKNFLAGTKGWRKYIVMGAAIVLFLFGAIDETTLGIILGPGLLGTGIAANGRHKAEGR